MYAEELTRATPFTIHKINTKQIKDLNIWLKTMKSLQDISGERFVPAGSPKHRQQTKSQQMAFYRIKSSNNRRLRDGV